MRRLLLSIAVCFGLVQVVFGQSDSVAAKPSHVVGDTWIYRTVDWGKEKRRNKFVVLAVKGDVISLESTPVQIDGATNVGTPGKFNALLDKWDFFGSRIVSGSRSNIRFPLSVGDKWSYEYALANMTLQYEVSVDALEDVAVPAGTFRAFKIVHSGRYKMSDGSSTVRETFWYAPNVRNFVKWEHQSRAFNGSMYDNVQRELTEYKVN